jgi:hypothetical protein
MCATLSCFAPFGALLRNGQNCSCNFVSLRDPASRPSGRFAKQNGQIRSQRICEQRSTQRNAAIKQKMGVLKEVYLLFLAFNLDPAVVTGCACLIK